MLTLPLPLPPMGCPADDMILQKLQGKVPAMA
jgi:hypothetical protein